MSQLVWSGLQELKAALRNLPTELAAEATGIVSGRAERAMRDIETSYPERTGNLRKGLRLGSGASVGRFGASTILKNVSPHAWIFENGTQARHNDLGANRGAMPPGHIFIPIVIRQRRAMYHDLAALLERHGFTVSGVAA